jgi:Ca-activated chloride channel family protein
VKKSTSKKGKQKGKKTRRDAMGREVLLPLRHISYKGAVNGVFAKVRCIQEFGNNAENPVEAVYVFPLPDEASVTACTMKIGKRSVEAELKKREEARKEYDAAVAAGHHGALVEQERPNIFTMNVGGIEKGEKISVEVDYIQRIPWQAGGGRFTIPLVVAPQFIPGTPVREKPQAGGFSPDTDEVPDASKITPVVAKEGVSYRADISVLFSPGFKCELSCPSHPSIVAERTFAKTESTEIKTGDILTDRDFTLVYKSLSKVPEVAVHFGDFQGENFLLASIMPPGDTTPIGSDIVLVLDCSGSMHGPSIEGLKVIGKKIINNLKGQKVNHRVAVVPFDDRPWPEHSISEIDESTEKFIDSLEARGGTMLGLALEKAEQILAGSSRPKAILLVTDGDTSNGGNWYGNGIRLIAVGISSAINDTRIKELARRNSGTAEFVYPGEDYSAVANRLTGYLSGPVLMDVKVKADGEAVGVYDVFKGRPATIAVRFSKKADKVKIIGKDPEGKELSWEVSSADAKKCDFIAQIWARELIREKQDKGEQTQASLKYGVICSHTSFVAVSLKEVPGKKPERVEIPVNLPVGWDYDSVFGGTAKGMAMFAVGNVSSMRRLRSPSIMSLDACCAEEVLADSDLAKQKLRGAPAPIPPVPPRPPVPPVPSIPTIPPVPPVPVASTRFTLDAKDLVDRTIAILVAVAAGKRDEAEKAFKELKKELTPRAISMLSDEKKAMLKYFLYRIYMYGLNVDRSIISKLSWKKETSAVKVWNYLALKEEGTAPVQKPSVPASYEASEYFAWKFGLRERLYSGEWSVVP